MTEAVAKDALEALVAANEAAFVPEGSAPEFAFEDDEDVSMPPSGITFGMIRRAREALSCIHVDPDIEPGDRAPEPENFE